MRYKRALHNILHLFTGSINTLSIRSNLCERNFPWQTTNSRAMSTDVEALERTRVILKDMFQAGLKAVAPRAVIKNQVKFRDGTLRVADKSFPLAEKNIYLVGFGKAVMGMAMALELVLDGSLKRGIVSVPSVRRNAIWDSEDMADFPKLKTGVIEYREGGLNNQPDDRSLETTHEIIDLVESLTEKDTLIVLISGGGSALLYMPRAIIDREDKVQLCRALQNAGADIRELNTVRRKLSMVKGGGLARMAYPATVISLILSDIVGDPIDLIASGPTVYGRRSPDEVVSILRKYNLYRTVEGDLKTVVTCRETFNDAPLLNQAREFKHVTNIILGSNSMALDAVAIEAKRKKLTPIILRSDITGQVQDVSQAYAHVTSLVCLALEGTLTREEFFERIKDAPVLSLTGRKVDEIYDLTENISGEGLVLIGGGEPTVVVKGQGKGGRNQELALYFSMDWLARIKSYPGFAEYDVLMLSGGTDGQDGPTDAAGAFGYPAIGPIMRDLHAKIKSLCLKESLMPDFDRRKVEQSEPVRDPCKASELSGYLSMRKPETEEIAVDETASLASTVQEEEEVEEEEEDPLENINPLELQTMEVERMLPENALAENDTYNFYSRFKRGADHLKTGFTGTNVMDLHFIYIRKRSCDCKIDYTEGRRTENCLEGHDLSIDPATIERYRAMRRKLGFKEGRERYKSVLRLDDKADRLNIKIIDDNLQDPCCRRDRKFPEKTLLKNKDFLL